MKIIYADAELQGDRLIHRVVVRRGSTYLAALSVTIEGRNRTHLVDQTFRLPDMTEEEALEGILDEMSLVADEFIDKVDAADEAKRQPAPKAAAPVQSLFVMRGNGARN